MYLAELQATFDQNMKISLPFGSSELDSGIVGYSTFWATSGRNHA